MRIGGFCRNCLERKWNQRTYIRIRSVRNDIRRSFKACGWFCNYCKYFYVNNPNIYQERYLPRVRCYYCNDGWSLCRMYKRRRNPDTQLLEFKGFAWFCLDRRLFALDKYYRKRSPSEDAQYLEYLISPLNT